MSEKETQVSRLVCDGLTNREIADLLNVSIRTVEVQRASAMKKMQTETLAEFVTKIASLNV